MKITYASQREMIINSESLDKVLSEWPFLGKVIIVYSVYTLSKATSILAMAMHFFQ